MGVGRALIAAVDGSAAATKAFAAALARVGVADATVLHGAAASKSAVESRLRKLAAASTAGDAVWFVYVGDGFAINDDGFLRCADTLDDDREATSLAVSEVHRMLSATGATLRFLLDAAGVADDQLDELFPIDRDSVALGSARFGDASHAAGGKRLWLHLVGEALVGKAPSALSEGELTAGSLQAWLTEELPRAVRKAVSEPTEQQPRLHGSPHVVLAKVEAAPTTPKLNLKQLKRIVFRGETRDRFKNLGGYQKGQKIPDAATPSAQKWTYRLAADDLRSRLDDTFNALRERLGFRRKDLETTLGADGVGIIRTPRFDFTISVSLDPDDPTDVVWRREVSRVGSVDILREPGFLEVFAGSLGTLEFEFEKPIDVAALVDRIEEDPPPGVTARVAPDASWCELTVAGFAGKIGVDRARLRVEGGAATTPDSLVAQFFAFLSQVGGKRGLPALKG